MFDKNVKCFFNVIQLMNEGGFEKRPAGEGLGSVVSKGQEEKRARRAYNNCREKNFHLLLASSRLKQGLIVVGALFVCAFCSPYNVYFCFNFAR